MNNAPSAIWLKDVSKEDLLLVGGSGVAAGEMIKAGFPAPNGFVVTTNSYLHLLAQNELTNKIRQVLAETNIANFQQLKKTSQKIKSLIIQAEIPFDLSDTIIKHYRSMDKKEREPWSIIRSEFIIQNSRSAHLSDQETTILNVKGTANLIQKIRQAWASLFDPSLILLREQNNIDHFQVVVAVIVQKLVQAEVSGVMFTVDPLTGDKNQILIEAIWGLPELTAKESAMPDRYLLDKKTFTIIQKIGVNQSLMLSRKGLTNKIIKVPNKKQKQLKLTDIQITSLAQLGRKIQQHYFFPQEIEWQIAKNKIYVLKIKPITDIPRTSRIYHPSKTNTFHTESLKLLFKGEPASPGIKTGKVRIIHTSREINKVKRGEILVINNLRPDIVPALRNVVALITDAGKENRTSNAGMISRELGMTCVVGVHQATRILKNGQLITVNGNTGEIFLGVLPPQKIKTQPIKNLDIKLQSTRKTATKIYVDLSNPDLALDVAFKNVDGVGLLKSDFMLSQIGIHPKKLIVDKKQKQFINKLSDGIETVCRSFNPRPVVYRTIDFKTNQYRSLIGGSQFEPIEENPFFGYRGARRYISDATILELELEALKKVRNKAGFKNLFLTIPFIRSVQELVQVKRIIAAKGLTRSSTFKLWITIEVPANVIFLEQLIEVGIDGVSIDFNNLAMLLLGSDIDNHELKTTFDARNPAILWALETVIKTAGRNRLTSSICDHATNLYPEVVQKLIDWGITSLSVNPDQVDLTREMVYQAELKTTQKNKIL